MEVSFLLSECLEKVFLNLLDENPSGDTRTYTLTKDLYSCTLVSRHWCRISTPFLYAYPFHHFRHLAYSNIHYNNISSINYSSYFKLIRTLLSCIPKSEIEQLILLNSSDKQNLLPNSNDSFNYSNEKCDILTTFNYITFIRGLIFDKVLSKKHRLLQYREIWLFPYILNNDMKELSKTSISIINHLVKYLCALCNNLTTLEFPFKMQNNEFFSNIIEFLKYNDHKDDIKSKLSNLKELYYINNRDEETGSSPKDLYLTLSNDIYNLNLLYNDKINSIEEANSLSRFISLQKNLQRVILSEDIYSLNQMFSHGYVVDDYNVVFHSLSTQNKSLQVLEFKYLSFIGIDEKALESLYSLKNIRELKLFNCRDINDSLNSLAESLTKLEVFEFVESCFPIPEGFLIQLIKSSSNTLTRLVMHYERVQKQYLQLFQQIPLYSHSLIHLELSKIFPTELISVFKSCTRLIYLSAILWDDDCELWKENFKNLGKFIPNTLQKIQLKEMYNLVFGSNELKCFFEECVKKGSKLKYLEVVEKCNYDVSQEYFDVAKEFDVELIKL